MGTADPSLPGPCHRLLSQNEVGAEADSVPLVTISTEAFLNSSLLLERPPSPPSQKREKEGLLGLLEQPWWWESRGGPQACRTSTSFTEASEPI